MSMLGSSVFAEKSLQQIQKEQTNLENEKNKLENEARKLDEEVQQLESVLADYNEEMNQQAALLIESEQKLELQKRKLESLLRSMYTENYLHPMAQLFEANNLNDFLERYDFMIFFLGEQHQAISDFKEIQQKAQERRKELVDLSRRQDEVLKKAQQKRRSLELKILKLGKEIRILKATSDKFYLSDRDRNITSPYDRVAKGTGRFIWPVQGGALTDTFGSRGGRHDGIDIAARPFTAIYAADQGMVSLVKYDKSGYGHYLIISHGSGVQTLYAHVPLSSIEVKPGESVKKGQRIAGVGNTGRVRGQRGGYHLHFEIRVNGTPKNPLAYVSK